MKRNIAIVAGGYSGEYEVSLKSAQTVFENINREYFNPYLIVWKKIPTISLPQIMLCEEGTEYPVDFSTFTCQYKGITLKFDFVFITIHGTPGEDGKLQGYFDLLNIPYSTGGVLCESLTFDKVSFKHFVNAFGIETPQGICVNRTNYTEVATNCPIPLPLFVKPCEGGSSIATTRVTQANCINDALEKAICADVNGQAMVETLIEGTEVTCGVIALKHKRVVLPLTEVVVHGTDFFDFEAKYSGSSDEITPARIPEQWAEHIQEITASLGEHLQLRGFYRADFIITPEGKPYLLEVNTVPGLTNESFIPKQLRAAGLLLSETLTTIIEDGLTE